MSEPRPAPRPTVLTGLFTPLFAVLHLAGSCWLGAHLWRLSGGIRADGAWTLFGASDWAWSAPVHVPAGLFFAADQGLGGIAAALAGSLLAGFVLARLLFREGARRWLWIALLAWVLVPVPSVMSLVYQVTVRY